MSQYSQIVREYLINLQNKITEKVQEEESVKFTFDQWQREEGGSGESRILENGSVFEKAGINFSDIQGKNLPASSTASRPSLAGADYQAMGLSLVFHPENPFAPTCHMNVRFFTTIDENDTPIWWFGGGYDLTPYYGFEEDVVHWHQTAKNACSPFGEDLYDQFKKQCDRYFFLPHRNEPRGIGGLFFDDYNHQSFEHAFALTQSIGDSFIHAYLPILNRRKAIPYEPKHKHFQEYRRGRYVEFNLLNDRGTLFGLQSKGRTESILMSLPPKVRWSYNYKPDAHSKEARLYSDFLIGQEWV